MIVQLARTMMDHIRLSRKAQMSNLTEIILIIVAFAVLLGLFIFFTQVKGSEATEATTGLLDEISTK